MTDTPRKISELDALTAPAAADYLPIVDVSEPTLVAKNKRITIEELLRGAPDGTAAAPSFAFESDPNTGLFSPGADAFGVATAGAERLRITSDGKLGLGTSSPQASFQVFSGTPFGALIKISDSGQATGAVILGDGATTEAYVGVWRGDRNNYSAVGNYLNLGGYAGVSISTGTASLGSQTAAITIDSSQRVGIGVTSPTSLLHLADAGDITVGTTTGTKIGTATTQKLGFWNATPVVQPAAVADATDAATVITQLNDLLAKLRTLGIIAT